MVRPSWSSTWLLLACLAVSGCARIQPAGPALVPGLSVRLRPVPGPDTIVYRRSITRAGQDSSAGTRTVVLRVVEAPRGTRLLEVEQRFPGGGGEIVDTAIAELQTLRAVAHRSHQPTRTMRFTFPGNDAEGTVISIRPAGDSVAQVRQPLGGPIFDSNVIDLVVAALPLQEGFTAELPFFIYERGGRVAMTVGTPAYLGHLSFAWTTRGLGRVRRRSRGSRDRLGRHPHSRRSSGPLRHQRPRHELY